MICEHDYCPHQHYNKCYIERLRNIQFSKRRPHQTAKAEFKFNRFPSSLPRSHQISNIDTLAYEKYMAYPVLQSEEENNFAKNYYQENVPDNLQLNNQIVEETKEIMNQNSAYVLAAAATKDYLAFTSKRQNHLINAKNRAKAAFKDYIQQKKLKQEALKSEQRQWIIDYVRKVQTLIEHIFAVKGKEEDPVVTQERIFLRQNRETTAKALKSLKVTDPQAALKILSSVRAVLLKRKEALTAEREQQDHHRSMSASAMDQSASQNVSSASFVSLATNDATQFEGEQHFAERYCDFDELKKKWGVTKIEEIRNILRRLLGNNLINKAEGRHMREKRKAVERDEITRKQMQKMGHSLPARQEKTKSKGGSRKAAKSQSRPLNSQDGNIEIAPYYKQALNKDQVTAKTAILKGGQFDSVGDIFTRNRNYSQIFRKRTLDCSFDLAYLPKEDTKCHSTRVHLR